MAKKQWRGIRTGVLGMMICFVALMGIRGSVSAGEVKKFTLVNVLLDGTKIWLPSTIIVSEGDQVELTLDNKLTAPHGFKLVAFGIEVEVPSKKKKTIRFTANTAGVHTFACQLHAAHIGGQVVVQNK